MGGHGGKRLGAGRKPKTQKARWLAGNAGKVNISLVTSALGTPKETAEPEPLPEGRSPSQTPDAGFFWESWAHLARSRGTLIPQTEPGFLELCELAAEAASLKAWIKPVGYMFETTTVDGSGQEHKELHKHPLLTEWRQLKARVEMMQARFGLTGDGKVPAEANAGDEEDLKLARILAVK